jgi:YidC/Oxa1 family membrane protein insertase
VTSLLNPLADLVAWVIVHLHAGLGALFGPDTGLAWGLSIAILVILIRICLIPLFVKQVHAQRKMAQHAPQLAELRKKYKNDKQRLNEETMKFYKENGVNPLAGCLPMIPQMIIFFALFYVLRAIAEWSPAHYVHGHLVPASKPQYGLTVPVLESAQKATIFGVHLYDKIILPHTPGMGTIPTIVALITVAISASTTFLTVRQSSKRGLMQTSVDPTNPMASTQKYMMYIVPFFSLTGLYWQYGLVLYWVTTNLWTLGQQYFMFRNWTVEPAPPSKTATAAGGLIRATRSAMRSEPGSANAAASSAKPASGTAKTTAGSARAGGTRPAAGGTRPASGSARPGAGGARPAAGGGKPASTSGPRTAAARPATSGGTGNGRPASGAQAQAGTGNGRPASGASARPKTGSGSGGASSSTDRVRTGSASRDAAANSPGPPNGQDGAARRLLRLGKKPEPAPEPEPEVTTKVVRQQPVRQAKSKRSGKR